MQDRKDTGALEKELTERLNWYMDHASGEEYDEKAVEYISYLLDSIAPLEEGVIPPRSEAWERFQEIVGGQQELLPLEEESLEDDLLEEQKPISENRGTREKTRKFRQFVAQHKIIAAAVLVILILAVSGTIQAGAKKGTGFFFWLKSDDTGTQMITSPENLDDLMEVNAGNYYSRDEVPEWAQEWTQKQTEFVAPENYEWQHFEINKAEYYREIRSFYWDKEMNRGLFLGMYIFFDETAYQRVGYIGYSYVQSYEIAGKQADLYSREEESGKIYYVICIYVDNCKYFIEGQDNLEELKGLMEEYWDCMVKR